MTNEQFSSLQRGDIVRGRVSGNAYVIDSNIGSGYIGVNTVLLTHADEWEYCTPKKVEVQHSLQQLKAEILALRKNGVVADDIWKKYAPQ